MMKSKAEIIDALNKCKVEQCLCNECPYDGSMNCSGNLMVDVLALLNKNGFEVVAEVLDKSLTLDWEHYSEDDDYYGTKRLSAKDAYGTVYELAFDIEGNIL